MSREIDERIRELRQQRNEINAELKRLKGQTSATGRVEYRYAHYQGGRKDEHKLMILSRNREERNCSALIEQSKEGLISAISNLIVDLNALLIEMQKDD